MHASFRQFGAAVNEVLSFLSALAGSLFDPVLMSGCLLAGWYLRPAIAGVLVAIEWNVLVYAVMLVLAFREGHARFFISLAQYLGSCAAAAGAAGLVRWLAKRDQQERPVASMTATRLAWATGSLFVLVALLAAWVAYAHRVLDYYHDLFGPAYYWERANLHPPYWAMDYPRAALVALLAIAVVWLCVMVWHRRQPRSCFFLLAAYVYLEFLFWAALGVLNPGNYR